MHFCFRFLLIIFFVGIISKSSSLTLYCDFKEHQSYWGLKYACVAQNLTTTETDRTITAINGTHIDGKANDDVMKVLISHQQCPYLPINLAEHFKNLEILYVMHSHVSVLTNKDLGGLTKLKIFDVSYNPIRELHKNYFIGHETIEIVSFYDCNLRYIETGALETLTNLKEGHFQYNECVDFRGDAEMLLPLLIQKLEESCDPANEKHKNHDTYHDMGSYREIEYREDYEDYEFYIPKSSTKKPVIEIRKEKEYLCEMSFTRRNANAIILFLITILVALLGFMFKSNSFTRFQ